MKQDTYRKTFEFIRGPIAAYVVMAILYVVVISKKMIWFGWHPFAMILGFVGLASNATIIKKIGGAQNTRIHGYLMSAATALGLFGGYVIYTNKEMFHKAHYTTNHGKFGLVVMIVYVSLGLAGAIFLHPDFGILKTNQLIRKVHRFAGLIFTAGAWLCCCSGKQIQGYIRCMHVFTVGIIIIGFATLHQTLLERALFAIPLTIMAYFVLL